MNNFYKSEENQLLTIQTFLGRKTNTKLKGYRTIDPSMIRFLLGQRKSISILDIKPIIKKCAESLLVIDKVVKQKGHILIVNTHTNMPNYIRYFAVKLKNFGKYFSYSNINWVGGTLTNWKQIAPSILQYLSFASKFGSVLTKTGIHFPQYKKWKKNYHGFTYQYPHFGNSLKSHEAIRAGHLKRPALIIVINPKENEHALREAQNLGIPVIAFINSDTDLSLITYPIPVNKDSVEFIHLYFSWILRILQLK